LRIWNRGEKSTRQRVSKERIPSEMPRTRRALGIAQADHTPIDRLDLKARIDRENIVQQIDHCGE
jgi:hypothetical protein